MGTYTTNYNLFLPSIGEQGWGELVNGNFSTIDTTMKGLGNNIGTLETEINAVEERVTVLETGNFESVDIGTLKFDSIIMPTLSYNGYANIEALGTSSGIHNMSVTLFSSPFPISGVISLKTNTDKGAKVDIITNSGTVTHTLTTTQTEYTVTNAYSIITQHNAGPTSGKVITYGIPKLI